MTKLNDIGVNEEFELDVLIEQSDYRLAKNGKHFLSLVFTDSSEKISGKYWDASEEDKTKFQSGVVIKLKGVKEMYNNSPQVKIKSMDPIDPSKVNIENFVSHAPETKEQMEEEINQLTFEITNPVWNRLVRQIIKNNYDDFFTYPAAKSNHHDFAGGLAYHTISMARLAESIADQYEQVNKELLLAGTLIHDIGKTKEFSGPIGTEYTLGGNLIGHITIVDEELVSAAKELKIEMDNEDFMLLRHMVLSHHGKLEYGSPEQPKILEAQILHTIDELDASINMITKALDKTVTGEFTDKIFGLDNRRFYRYEK